MGAAGGQQEHAIYSQGCAASKLPASSRCRRHHAAIGHARIHTRTSQGVGHEHTHVHQPLDCSHPRQHGPLQLSCTTSCSRHHWHQVANSQLQRRQRGVGRCRHWLSMRCRSPGPAVQGPGHGAGPCWQHVQLPAMSATHLRGQHIRPGGRVGQGRLCCRRCRCAASAAPGKQVMPWRHCSRRGDWCSQSEHVCSKPLLPAAGGRRLGRRWAGLATGRQGTGAWLAGWLAGWQPGWRHPQVMLRLASVWMRMNCASCEGLLELNMTTGV